MNRGGIIVWQDSKSHIMQLPSVWKRALTKHIEDYYTKEEQLKGLEQKNKKG